MLHVRLADNRDERAAGDHEGSARNESRPDALGAVEEVVLSAGASGLQLP